jgi:predicted transcriptional regulator
MKGALKLSRLEKCIAILEILDSWNAITQKQVLQKAELNLDSPMEYLSFLVNLELVRERILGTKTTYSITYKGQRVCKYFRSKNDESIFAGTRITRID